MARQFSGWQRAALAIAQGDLPHSLAPYADIAAQAGATEADVIALFEELRQSGAIRRFGASIRHQRAGWTCNAMVAWEATPEQADLCGATLADNANVSHAYYRPSSSPEWPYTFYTMVHGRSEAECDNVIAALAEAWRLERHAVLRSSRELKKTSMRYFA